MKTNVITVLLAIFTIAATHAQKDMDHFEVQVDGLGCPFCAYGLEKKFKEFKGIKDVAIDIETGDFSFNYPSVKKLSLEDVVTQVEKAGYTPITSKIIRSNGEVEETTKNELQLTAMSDMVTQEILVAGKCGMCEARILNATNQIVGVSMASWDKDTKQMTVAYDKSQTTVTEIQKKIAKAGHDTKSFTATDASYKNLPACCKYERITN